MNVILYASALLWMFVAPAAQVNSNLNNTDDEIETYSPSTPAWSLAFWSIPTAIGAYCTYKVIMGDRSSKTFAQALEQINRSTDKTQRISIALRNVLNATVKHLKKHEIIAFFATLATAPIQASSAVANFCASIVHGIKSWYATDPSTRKKHRHNMNITLDVCGGNLLLGSISLASFLLLIDYARDGRTLLGLPSY